MKDGFSERTGGRRPDLETADITPSLPRKRQSNNDKVVIIAPYIYELEGGAEKIIRPIGDY